MSLLSFSGITLKIRYMEKIHFKHFKMPTVLQVVDGEKIDGTECSDSKEDIVEQLLSQSLQENSHKCCICAKEIKIKYNMKRHLRTHLPGQIKCIMCNQFFNSLEEKEEHMEKRHASHHICETCGVSFKRKSDLNAHMIKHNSITEQNESSSLLRCTHKNCGKIFFRKANYEYHLNKHSGEKPYYCTSCLKTFHSKYVKNEHEKECSLNKQYKCEVCGSVFKQRSGLHNHIQAEHVRSEKGYTCEVCSLSFKFASGLIRHKKEKHQCLDASQQTENVVNLSAVSLQLHQVQTKEAQRVVTAQNTNEAVIVVAEGDSEQIGMVTTNVIEQVDAQTPENVEETILTEIKGTVPNPVLEKNPEINIGRVIVVHQVSGDLPDHLEGLNS